MALREQLNEDIKSAMKAREQHKLDALRLLSAAAKHREVDERITLDDAALARAAQAGAEAQAQRPAQVGRARDVEPDGHERRVDRVGLAAVVEVRDRDVEI